MLPPIKKQKLHSTHRYLDLTKTAERHQALADQLHSVLNEPNAILPDTVNVDYQAGQLSLQEARDLNGIDLKLAHREYRWSPKALKARARNPLGEWAAKYCALNTLKDSSPRKPWGSSTATFNIASVQAARFTANKTNELVFGLVTDATQFQFAVLTENKRLFLSKPLDWWDEKAEVVLQNAVESSPHTTLIRFANEKIGGFDKSLDMTYNFGHDAQLSEFASNRPEKQNTPSKGGIYPKAT
ncbi:hypothetical protein FQN50_006484 [Emmonsiellopsis sp. PD_5]|nr:hypothetical protein FQN50_006484 [Emmonsiellopsis sp. PD_5]